MRECVLFHCTQHSRDGAHTSGIVGLSCGAAEFIGTLRRRRRLSLTRDLELQHIIGIGIMCCIPSRQDRSTFLSKSISRFVKYCYPFETAPCLAMGHLHLHLERLVCPPRPSLPPSSWDAAPAGRQAGSTHWHAGTVVGCNHQHAWRCKRFERLLRRFPLGGPAAASLAF